MTCTRAPSPHHAPQVEAAVLRAHPEWAETQVGDDLQAFSDFLFFVIGGSHALLSELAIAVFDTTSGFVEVYRGAHYPDPASSGGGGGGTARMSEAQQRANLLCIQYVPGHYQALVPPPTGRKQAAVAGPTLAELLKSLDLFSVRYVVTDG